MNKSIGIICTTKRAFKAFIKDNELNEKECHHIAGEHDVDGMEFSEIYTFGPIDDDLYMKSKQRLR